MTATIESTPKNLTTVKQSYEPPSQHHEKTSASCKITHTTTTTLPTTIPNPLANFDQFSYRETSKDIISALVGSMACAYTGQPFDTVKVRVQSQPSSSFLTPVSCLKNIVNTEGIRALWKGVVPTCLGMMAENAVAFGINEQLKRIFPRPEEDVCYNNTGSFDFNEDIIKPMSMGGFSGCCASFILIPSENIKTKTQVCTHFRSSWQISKDILSKQGIMNGYFCAMDAQLIRDAPFYATFFASYEGLVRIGKFNFPNFDDEIIYFMSGGFAGMIATAIAMPFDVPKTIVQSSYTSKFIGDVYKIYKHIYRTQGILGFYAGLGPSLVRAFPANAALFLGVELTKKGFDFFLPQP